MMIMMVAQDFRREGNFIFIFIFYFSSYQYTNQTHNPFNKWHHTSNIRPTSSNDGKNAPSYTSLGTSNKRHSFSSTKSNFDRLQESIHQRVEPKAKAALELFIRTNYHRDKWIPRRFSPINF